MAFPIFLAQLARFFHAFWILAFEDLVAFRDETFEVASGTLIKLLLSQGSGQGFGDILILLAFFQLLHTIGLQKVQTRPRKARGAILRHAQKGRAALAGNNEVDQALDAGLAEGVTLVAEDFDGSWRRCEATAALEAAERIRGGGGDWRGKENIFRVICGVQQNYI